MRLQRLWLYTGRDDILPPLVGCAILLISLPGFLVLLFFPDAGGAYIRLAMLVVLGSGVLLGLAGIIFGIATCSSPGTWTYRISHGRIFWH